LKRGGVLTGLLPYGRYCVLLTPLLQLRCLLICDFVTMFVKFLPREWRDVMHKRGLCPCRHAVSVSPPIRVFVWDCSGCLSRSCILSLSKQIFKTYLQKIFTVGWPHYSGFSTAKVMTTGASNASGVCKNRDSLPISSSFITPLAAHNKIHTIQIHKIHRNRDKRELQCHSSNKDSPHCFFNTHITI